MVKVKTLIFCILCFLAVAAKTSFGAEAKYQENKFGDYLIRVNEGPSEPASTGSYSILIYKNSGDEFITGAVQPRDGSVVKFWTTNAGRDDAIEIFVWTRSAGSGSYGDLALFKFNKVALQSIKLPAPDDSLLKGYMGRDEFDIKNGAIYRSFPIYLAKDSNCCPTGGTRTLQLDSVSHKWKLSRQK